MTPTERHKGGKTEQQKDKKTERQNNRKTDRQTGRERQKDKTGKMPSFIFGYSGKKL
jgi:hypothetical protein